MGRLSWAAAAVAWILAAVALTAGLLAQGGRFSLALDAFTHLAPLYLAAGLLALGLALLARPRSWKALSLIAAAAILNASAFVGPELMARPSETGGAEGPRLKIVAFNVWVDNARAEDVARWILAQEPDLVVLEEGRLVRSRLMAAGYEPACYGCAPVIFARTKPLRRFPPRGLYGDGSGFAWATYNDRRLGEYSVVAIHGPWPNRLETLQDQSQELQTHLARLPRERMILAGDLNSTPWSFFLRRQERRWGLVRRTRGVFTWPAQPVSHYPLPAPFPFLPIDHLYAGEGWTTVKVERGPKLGSDHYPLVVTLAPAKMTKNSRSAARPKPSGAV